MIQQVIENILKRPDWDSIEFRTTTNRATLYRSDVYEIDSFAIYIKHTSFTQVDVLDLKAIEQLVIKPRANKDGIPFYQPKAML